LLKAAEFHVIDLRRSWFVGDRYSDVATAEACGAHGLLVQTGHDGKDRDRFPDIQAKAGFASLSEAIDYILKTPL
jgi:histidinol phosphatase-like enzyme